MTKIFLQAEWRKLAMANYAIDKAILEPFLPYKTEIDLWEGRCYVSLVGFRFLNTRVMGFKIPLHTNFEEVNLRFYVRYKDKGEWKRGVVFIKEIVPKPALSFVANTLYKEHYETLPMKFFRRDHNSSTEIEYRWKKNNFWNILQVKTTGEANKIKEGSEEEFITEHYWGYTRINNNKTSEYEVTHPKWEVYKIQDYLIDVNFGDVYGAPFNFLTAEKPASVFLAEGSEIQVLRGKEIR